jgi:hypothetical protein
MPPDELQFMILKFRPVAELKRRLERVGFHYLTTLQELTPTGTQTGEALSGAFARRPFFGVPVEGQHGLVAAARRAAKLGHQDLADLDSYILLGVTSDIGLTPRQVEEDLRSSGLEYACFLPSLLQAERWRRKRWLRWKDQRQDLPAVDTPALAPLHLEAVAGLPGGRGDSGGLRLAIVDEGWNRRHRALRSLPVHHDAGVIELKASATHHGTAALSVVAGRELIHGIAPGISSLGVSSAYRWLHFQDQQVVHKNPAGALLHALTWLAPGDILLLEAQDAREIPLECLEVYFSLIRLAAVAGIIVVEPAGNAETTDLDTLPLDAPGDVRIGRRERDSGAIIVGAAVPTNERWRTLSSYGSRVDCFAPGQGVRAAGSYGGVAAGDPDTATTDGFGQSSLAAAVIAGVAAVVQSLFFARHGRRLTPGLMRAVLGTPGGGQGEQREADRPIGRLPDLEAIARAIL